MLNPSSYYYGHISEIKKKFTETEIKKKCKWVSVREHKKGRNTSDVILEAYTKLTQNSVT